jgi:hypothetical protein
MCGAHGHGVRVRVVRWHVGCDILPMEAGEEKYPSTAVRPWMCLITHAAAHDLYALQIAYQMLACTSCTIEESLCHANHSLWSA